MNKHIRHTNRLNKEERARIRELREDGFAVRAKRYTAKKQRELSRLAETVV